MQATRRKSIHQAMVRLSDGDRTALDALLDDLWPALLSFAERGLGHSTDAEDVAQDVFFKICQRIADFDRGRDGLSWAFGIASYEILTHRRRRQRRREVFDETLIAMRTADGNSQEENLLAKEMLLVLKRAAQSLSDADRRSLGLDGSDANRKLGATERKQKQRALDRLRTLWRQVYGDS